MKPHQPAGCTAPGDVRRGAPGAACYNGGSPHGAGRAAGGENPMRTSTIDQAVCALKRGEAVIFPTETVYGLGVSV